MIQKKEKDRREKDVLNDQCERSDDPRRSSSSVREAERGSLLHSIYDRLNYSAIKMLREGDERAKALLLLDFLDIHQSKPMRVNMKEPVEL